MQDSHPNSTDITDATTSCQLCRVHSCPYAPPHHAPPRLRYFLRYSYTGAQGAESPQRQNAYLHFVSVLCADMARNGLGSVNAKAK